jgi:RNA polymerase sigma factor (TIGR02999 family)
MSHDLTERLIETASDPPEKVVEKLMPYVYDELRALARKYLGGERKNHTLQPTALVHEMFLKLVDQSRVDWKGRTHFLAVGAAAMRRILIDHARTRKRDKRGGGWQRVVLEPAMAVTETGDVDGDSLHAALEELARLDADQARIVELRFFGGLSMKEVAAVLGVSKRKVEGDWTHAKAWLRTRLASEMDR